MVSTPPLSSTVPSTIHWSSAAWGKKTRFSMRGSERESTPPSQPHGSAGNGRARRAARGRTGPRGPRRGDARRLRGAHGGVRTGGPGVRGPEPGLLVRRGHGGALRARGGGAALGGRAWVAGTAGAGAPGAL